MKLYGVLIDNDATMLEINPMTEDANGQGIVLLAILVFTVNGLQFIVWTLKLILMIMQVIVRRNCSNYEITLKKTPMKWRLHIII